MKQETNTNKVEREYIIYLKRKCDVVPRYKKANKAIRTIKEFLARHMKIRDRDLKKIRIDRYLNEAVWFRGIKKPPKKIKVKAVKESDKEGEIVRVYLAEMPEKLKFKKIREEKREKKALERIEKKKPAEEAEKKKTAEDGREAEKKKEEEKIEEKEKKSSIVEAGEKMEKEIAKKQKHEVKAKSPKQEKDQRVGYNRSSRGK